VDRLCGRITDSSELIVGLYRPLFGTMCYNIDIECFVEEVLDFSFSIV